MDFSGYIAMAGALFPFVTGIAAVVNKMWGPPTRYKPGIALTIGVVLGILAALLFAQAGIRLQDGATAGLIAGLMATGYYAAGKAREEAAISRNGGG